MLCDEIQSSSSMSGDLFRNAAVAVLSQNAIQVSLILQQRSQLVAIHGKLPLVRPNQITLRVVYPCLTTTTTGVSTHPAAPAAAFVRADSFKFNL
jgi:hypothetical protein